MRETREPELMRGSLNSPMGEPLMANNKLAYSGHQELPIAPDAISSGTPATREALSDPDSLRSLRALWFYLLSVKSACPPCEQGEAGGCVPRCGTRV